MTVDRRSFSVVVEVTAVCVGVMVVGPHHRHGRDAVALQQTRGFLGIA